MKNMLIKSLYSKLKTDKDSYNFIMNLMNCYDLYLFGGGVRDILNNNLKAQVFLISKILGLLNQIYWMIL